MIYNAKLIQAISDAVGKVIRRVYSQPEPVSFYHYTNVAARIIQSRCLWAVPLSKQKNDSTELEHGLTWVREAISQMEKQGHSEFTGLILQRVVDQMLIRKKWTFITCFCAEGASLLHQGQFGSECLSFSRSEMNALRCGDWRAAMWLQPVLYDHEIQQRAVYEAVKEVAGCLDKYASGDPRCPWIAEMAKQCAREVGQILLGLLTGFKNGQYRNEREWRLVCYPRLALGSTAPSMADEDFRAHIVSEAGTDPTHIELRPLPRHWANRGERLAFGCVE